jgi:hypothetical protein
MKRHIGNLTLAATLATGIIGADALQHIGAEAWGNCTVRRGATYYSAVCQGTGAFHAEAICKDGDNLHPYRDYANVAYAPTGVSDDNCKFGFHPTTIYIY